MESTAITIGLTRVKWLSLLSIILLILNILEVIPKNFMSDSNLMRAVMPGLDQSRLEKINDGIKPYLKPPGPLPFTLRRGSGGNKIGKDLFYCLLGNRFPAIDNCIFQRIFTGAAYFRIAQSFGFIGKFLKV